jgi:hypothetical protein
MAPVILAAPVCFIHNEKFLSNRQIHYGKIEVIHFRVIYYSRYFSRTKAISSNDAKERYGTVYSC